MSAGSAGRVSTLERRSRLLLRFYPAAYRSERGEEIIGTLLDATPPGRAWPLPRDIRGLAVGGVRVRAAINRRNTTTANLRIAVLAGVTAYLAYSVAGMLSSLLVAARHGHIDLRGTRPVPFDWPLLVVAASVVVTLVLAWLGRRRAIVVAGAVPAVAALAGAGGWRTDVVTELACLAALIALAGRGRPDRQWLWLVGPIALAQLLTSVGPAGSGAAAGVGLLLTAAIASIAWLAIDARPAIAIVVFLLAAAIDNLATGVFSDLPLLGICTVVAVPALWLLRRQSAHAGRPTQT